MFSLQNLELVLLTVTEYEQSWRERGETEALLNKGGKSVNGFT